MLERDERFWNGFVWLRIGDSGGYYGHCDTFLGSVKCWEFLVYMRGNVLLFEKYSTLKILLSFGKFSRL
jgi:hypothetical protein